MKKQKTSIIFLFLIIILLVILYLLIHNRGSETKKESTTEQSKKSNKVSVVKPKIPEKPKDIKLDKPKEGISISTVNKEIEKVVNIKSNFKRIKNENKVEWSKDLAENSENLQIIFTVNGKVMANEDVTNNTFYIYNPGTSEAQGKKTKVELIANFGTNKIIIKDKMVLYNEYFICSSNN